MNTTGTNKRLKGGLSTLVLLACFAGWAVGGDPGQCLAEKAPDWTMIPLMIDYDLAFGYICGRLTNVTVTVGDNIFRSLKTPGKY